MSKLINAGADINITKKRIEELPFKIELMLVKDSKKVNRTFEQKLLEYFAVECNLWAKKQKKECIEEEIKQHTKCTGCFRIKVDKKITNDLIKEAIRITGQSKSKSKNMKHKLKEKENLVDAVARNVFSMKK